MTYTYLKRLADGESAHKAELEMLENALKEHYGLDMTGLEIVKGEPEDIRISIFQTAGNTRRALFPTFPWAWISRWFGTCPTL